MKEYRRPILFLVLVFAILFVASLDVNAQCAMCRAVISGSNNGKFMRNLNMGVLVLLLPPVSIFCSIFIILRRHLGEHAPDEVGQPESNSASNFETRND